MAEEPKPQFAEDEDLERAKAFWNENGRSIIAGIVLGVGAIGGYNGWQYWQKDQGENASTLFENMQDESVSFEAAKGLADDLVSDYGKTPYAIHAALLMAKRAVEADDLDEAAGRLKWATSNAADPGLKHIARIRLAMVHLAKGDADAVLDLASETRTKEVGGLQFGSRYAELRGDAYVMKGDLQAARQAYEQSIEALAPGASNRTLLQLKIDNL
ncbi:MAG: tetratricopeptide repeat protein [Acidiferrobacterales bacterium]|nr:tetratricopeptide repeat protein [Acidiferrobacterales bacterium]